MLPLAMNDSSAHVLSCDSNRDLVTPITRESIENIELVLFIINVDRFLPGDAITTVPKASTKESA